MGVTPTGNLSLPLTRLRTILLASTNWQTWCGGASAATAASFLISCPPHQAGPHAIIDHDGTLTRTRDGVTVGRFVQTGGLLLYIASQAMQKSNEDALLDFMNHVDAVLGDLEAYPPGGGVGLAINGLSLVNGPSRIAAQERDKHGDLLEILIGVDVTVWP